MLKLQDDGRVLNSDGTDSHYRIEYSKRNNEWMVASVVEFHDGTCYRNVWTDVYDSKERAFNDLVRLVGQGHTEKVAV